jgi:hypothetical protein
MHAVGHAFLALAAGAVAVERRLRIRHFSCLGLGRWRCSSREWLVCTPRPFRGRWGGRWEVIFGSEPSMCLCPFIGCAARDMAIRERYTCLATRLRYRR